MGKESLNVFKLLKKEKLFILRGLSGNKVIQYKFECPLVDSLVFDSVLDNEVCTHETSTGMCATCKHKQECDAMWYRSYFISKSLFVSLLKHKKLVKYNKINAILYLDKHTREKVEKWLADKNTTKRVSK